MQSNLGEPTPGETQPLAGTQQTGTERRLWRSLEHSIDLPLVRTCFVEAGQGFPILLIHGLMGYSFSWRKNLAALGEHFRVLALDLAGCGYSGSLKRGKYGVETWSQQIEEFMDALGLGTAHLIATSAGGAAALDFAARCADRVGKLVLVAPVNPFSRRVVLLARAYAWTGLPDWLLKPLVKRSAQILPWSFRRRFYCDPARITPETIPGYLEGLRLNFTVPMLREAICGWNPAKMEAQMSRVKAPALLVWGERDTLVPISCLPRLANALPNASSMTMAGTGHFCYEELPELFNQHVLSFFQKAPVPGAIPAR